MLTCQQILDYLSDYIEERMSPAELARFDEHLAACPPCVDYLASFRAMLAACRCLRDAELAPLLPVPAELVQAILAARTL